MIEQIFLDMDGVLTDFVGGISRAHNRPNPYEQGQGLGIFQIEQVWGITPSEGWAPTNSYEFWYNLEYTPEADMIVALATEKVGAKNVAILTAPSQFEGCVNAKRASITRRYPFLAKRMIFTAAKEFVAAPGKLLIDDKDSNIDKWREQGGVGILVPRLWNRYYLKAHKTADVIRWEFSWQK